ncbi:MAG: hypothetical protein KGQ59_06700 [Bdellovibrionales bacterium]|nr:hypothetical protein [Bdellovibrionales bacterium]
MRSSEPVQRVIVLLVVGLISSSTQSFATDQDLCIANRYFAQRKQAQHFIGIAASGSEALQRLRPDGFKIGEQWGVRLRLKGIESSIDTGSSHPEIELRYTVLEWSGYPDATLLLRTEVQKGGPRESYLEQRLVFSEGFSWIRRCRSSGECSSWVSITSKTVRLGGDEVGLGWEHGPVALDASSVALSRFRQHSASSVSDDFFGRKSDWTWGQGDPWPLSMRNAQGTASLISPRGDR